MDKEEIIIKLKYLAQEIAKYYNLKILILFGSYSRNEQKEFSDIDVAVIIEKFNNDYLKDSSFIWGLAGDIDSRIEPVIFEENRPDFSGFKEQILKNGIIIYSN